MEGENRLKLFTGSSHPGLAREVAEYLGIQLGAVALETFPDGESWVQLQENVRGCDVFVMQSVALRPNATLMQLLIMIDAFRRASVRSVTAVLPYFGYCRQDRKDRGRVPITARLVANLLERAGADRVLTMDLHTDQVQGFFDLPVDNLQARPELLRSIKCDLSSSLENMVVVGPDVGSAKLAHVYADGLGTDMALVDKRRLDASTVAVSSVVGDVKGRDVLLVDDMCTTGGTLMSAAEACERAGARTIHGVVTHGLFVGEALNRLERSPIEQLYVSNTIPGTESLVHPKVKVVSVANLFGEAISRILTASSVSSLFT